MEPANKLRTVLLILLLLLVMMRYVWLRPSAPAAQEEPREESSTACPYDDSEKGKFGRTDYKWVLTRMDSEQIRLSEFRDKVIFVNVWATWCGPCRMEMPAIQALHDSMKTDNVAFVLVSEEEPETVQEYIEKNEFRFPVYVSRGDLPDEFQSDGIPATFIVDRQGHVVLRSVGASDWNSNGCRAYLRSLM